MSLQKQAEQILRDFDIQTTVGKFAQDVLDYLEQSCTKPYTLTKVSNNKGATITDLAYEGNFLNSPQVECSFNFYVGSRIITTSTVTEVSVVNENTTEIKTLNSSYLLTRNTILK